MKILFAVEHYFPYIGGAEKLHQSVAEALAEAGHEVVVITTRFKPSLLPQEKLNGVQVYRIPINNRFLFSFFGWLWMLQKAKKADLIQTASYNAAFPAFLAGWLSKKPVIVTFHEVWAELWKRLPLLRWWEKLGFSLYEKMLLKLPFTKYIAVSEYTRNQLIQNGVDPTRVTLIYNGVNYSEFEHLEHQPPNSFTPIYFARLGPSKGLDLLLNAWYNFAKTSTKAQLKLVIPTYPERFFKAIQQQIESLNIGTSITIFHELSKEGLQREILQSSCVVIPSYAEGFCFAAVESVALGMPVISSHQGALKETVSGRVIRLNQLDQDELQIALEKASKGEFQSVPTKLFPLKDQVNQYIQLYTSLLE